jgi:hypothetical protein
MPVYTEYMRVYTFTADFLSIVRGHIVVHTRTSEYIRCATVFSCLRGPPASCWPACTVQARLNFKAAHSWQKQDTFVQEQISSLLCLPPSGSPVAASFSAAQSHQQYWQREPAAQSATATLRGRRIRTLLLSPEVGLQG